MHVTIDPGRYPLSAAYVSALPGGLKAYPECVIRTDFTRHLQKDFPTLLETARVADELKAAMRHPWAEGEWMPLVLMFTLQTLLFEIEFHDRPARYQERVQSKVRAVFERPLYRAIVRFLSPNILLLGATKRWSHFMRGVRFDELPGGSRTSHTGRLVYPPHLLSPFAISTIGGAIAVALEATSASHPKVVVDAVTPTEARFSASWE